MHGGHRYSGAFRLGPFLVKDKYRSRQAWLEVVLGTQGGSSLDGAGC